MMAMRSPSFAAKLTLERISRYSRRGREVTAANSVDANVPARRAPWTKWGTCRVTSVAAMMLWEEGAFELGDPVAKYLPSFADMRVWRSGSVTNHTLDPVTEPMRMWHLMTHTSGLTYGFLYAHPVDELYRRPLHDDTLLPARARLGEEAPVQTLSGLRFRGNSSRALPKKGFHVRFSSGQPVLFGSDRMNLMANWTDPSMQRQTIALAMFRDLGLMASRTRQFDLFLNGIYEGLYTHVERVDGNLLGRYGRREGTLVRDQFRRDPDMPLSSLFGFDLAAIPEDERAAFVAARFDSRGSPDWHALVELALWQQATPAGTAFAEGFGQRFDVDHFIDWLALHVLVGDVDAFGDDYWLHLDPDDGLWRTLPWDKDLSFGKHYRGGFGVANDYFFYEYPVNTNHGNRLVRKVLDTPSLRTRLDQRVLELAGQVFTPDYFQTEVSALTEVLLDSIEIQAGPVAFHRHPANHHGALRYLVAMAK